MKSALKLSGILSWINLLITCFLVFSGLIGALITGNVAAGFVMVVLFGAIALHSYAALQLRKSIMYENQPLDSRTPAGIQIMGFISLFIAFVSVTNGFMLLRHSDEVINEMQKNLPAQFSNQHINMGPVYSGAALFIIVFGLCVLVNVMINMALLRWYKNQHIDQ